MNLPTARSLRYVSRTNHSRGVVNLIEVALVLPVLIGALCLGFEALSVRHRVNLVRYHLEEVSNEARSDMRLQPEFWPTGEGSTISDNNYLSARAEAAEFFVNRLGYINGVTVKDIQHIVTTSAGDQWQKLAIAFMPPGTSAYVDDAGWSYADINHQTWCYKSASETAAKSVPGSPPRLGAILGRRAGCQTGWSQPISDSEPRQSSYSLSKEFPMELVAAVDVKGLFGTHKAAVSVPFYPMKSMSTASLNSCTWLSQDSEFSGTLSPVYSETERRSMGGADYKVTYAAATDRLKVSLRPMLPVPTIEGGNLVSSWTLMQLAANISVFDNQSGTNETIFKVTHGSNDTQSYTGRTFQPDPSLGAGWYSHEIDLANVPAANWIETDTRNWGNEGKWSTLEYRCKPINLGMFFVINIREDDEANLERFWGLTAMTTPNSWGSFDWSWGNRLKLGIGGSP
jgi:hypothetical protein